MKLDKLPLFVLFIALLWMPVRAFQITNPKKLSPQKTTNSQTNEDELAVHLNQAEKYQSAGNWDGAVVENQAILAIGLSRLGNIALREGNFSNSVELIKEALAISDNSEARTNLAIAYMNEGNIDEAVIQADLAVKQNPQNARAYQTLGKLYYLKENFTAALPVLERAIVMEQNFDTAYTLGITYLQLKQVERTKLLFNEIQDALNKNAGLNILFGQAYETANYPLEAEREFKQAYATDPKILGAHFHLGYVILQNGGSERLAEAGKAFEQEILLNPQDGFSNFFAGVVASSENNHERAIKYFQEALRLNLKIAETYLFLGQSQSETGDVVNAETSLRRAIELTSDVSNNSFQIRRAHFTLGRLLMKSGRKDEGEKELSIARQMQGQLLESARQEIRKILGQVIASNTELSVNNPVKKNNDKSQIPPQELLQLKQLKEQLKEVLAQTYHNLGVIAVQQSRVEDSLANFASASKWNQNFPGLDRNWGIVAFRSNQFDKAVAPLARQVKAHPEDNLTRRMLGVSYYFTKNFKQAAEMLKPIEAAISSDPELAYFYGISLVQLERHPEAAQLFARLAAQNPKTAQTGFYAGQGFVFVGDYEKAVKEFRAAAALDPQMLQAHYSAGQSLIRMNQLDEAEKEFRQELALNPADESSKYHLAYTMLERKVKIDEAIGLLKEAIAARYDYADARYQLGKALIEKGDIAEAVSQLEIAAQNEPNKDYIRYQLSIAYRRASRPADAERELKLYSQLKAASRSQTPAGMGTQKNAP